MLLLLWLSDQILSGLIVGFFSLTATTINLVISGRRSPGDEVSAKADGKASGKPGGKAGGRAKKRPVVRKERARMRTVVLLGGWAVAAAFLVADLRERWGTLSPLGTATAAIERMGALQPPWTGEAEAAADRRVPRIDAGPSPAAPATGGSLAGSYGRPGDDYTAGQGAPPGADGGFVAGDPSATPLLPESSAAARSAWLEADGLAIHYRFASYLPGACPGEPVARGSWNGGWETAAPARCLDDAWLAFDLAPLLSSGRISFNVTYCVNFQDQQGAWGRHGAAEPAPGWAEIAVPAEGAVPGTLGFRVVRDDAGPRVVFTAEFPRAPC